MTSVSSLLSDGLAAFSNASSNCTSIAHAANDLCSKHTLVETFCLAQHPNEGGKIEQWIYVHADELPKLMEETPDWVFGMCEAVRAIAERKTDLITFCYADRSCLRIGIDWIPDENEVEWRTLRWVDNPFCGSVIRSGKGCEDPVMATAIILSNVIPSRVIPVEEGLECGYTGKGDCTDPVMVAGVIAYLISPYRRENREYRLTLCELSDAELAEHNRRRSNGFKFCWD
jgi:hypothetical protein